MPAGRELTYDYGATGSAGGGTSKRNLYDGNEAAGEAARKLARHHNDRMGNAGCASVKATSGTVVLESSTLTSSEIVQEPTAGGSSGEGGSSGSGHIARDSEGSKRADVVRHRCLCGARCCRGLLPCNRVIL